MQLGGTCKKGLVLNAEVVPGKTMQNTRGDFGGRWMSVQASSPRQTFFLPGTQEQVDIYHRQYSTKTYPKALGNMFDNKIQGAADLAPSGPSSMLEIV